MWIKVSDRVPEYSSWVLCFPKSITDTVPFVTNWPAGSALASHWMPLPAPPTFEDGGGAKNSIQQPHVKTVVDKE